MKDERRLLCILTLLIHYIFIYHYSKFSKIIPPGESACCHYSNRDCNAGGTQDDLLLFSVSDYHNDDYNYGY